MRPIISQFFMELSLWLYVDYLFSFYQTTSCTFLAIIKKLFFMDQPTLKIAAFAGPCYPIFFISSALLQGLKKPNYQMIINLMRMVILPVCGLSVAVLYLKVDFTTMFLVILIINYIFAAAVYKFSTYQIRFMQKNYNPNFDAV